MIIGLTLLELMTIPDEELDYNDLTKLISTDNGQVWSMNNDRMCQLNVPESI